VAAFDLERKWGGEDIGAISDPLAMGAVVVRDRD
jgi:hypothetical protein